MAQVAEFMRVKGKKVVRMNGLALMKEPTSFLLYKKWARPSLVECARANCEWRAHAWRTRIAPLFL